MSSSHPNRRTFQLEDVTEELCVMTLKADAKFREKLIRDLKNDVSNLVNYYANGEKSENLDFHELLLSKAYKDLDEKVQRCYVS